MGRNKVGKAWVGKVGLKQYNLKSAFLKTKKEYMRQTMVREQV
jgi:hypothetical protein